jgi:hypothetical protein
MFIHYKNGRLLTKQQQQLAAAPVAGGGGGEGDEDVDCTKECCFLFAPSDPPKKTEFPTLSKNTREKKEGIKGKGVRCSG